MADLSFYLRMISVMEWDTHSDHTRITMNLGKICELIQEDTEGAYESIVMLHKLSTSSKTPATDRSMYRQHGIWLSIGYMAGFGKTHMNSRKLESDAPGFYREALSELTCLESEHS